MISTRFTRFLVLFVAILAVTIYAKNNGEGVAGHYRLNTDSFVLGPTPPGSPIKKVEHVDKKTSSEKKKECDGNRRFPFVVETKEPDTKATSSK